MFVKNAAVKQSKIRYRMSSNAGLCNIHQVCQIPDVGQTLYLCAIPDLFPVEQLCKISAGC